MGHRTFPANHLILFMGLYKASLKNIPIPSPQGGVLFRQGIMITCNMGGIISISTCKGFSPLSMGDIMNHFIISSLSCRKFTVIRTMTAVLFVFISCDYCVYCAMQIRRDIVDTVSVIMCTYSVL